MGKVRMLAIASVGLVALSAPAMAQDAAADDYGDAGFNSGEIVVQARRRDESLQDVPAVVNAVTAEAVERLNIRRLEDVAAVVPGLNLVETPNGIGSSTTIRGVQFDVNASGDNGTVQYYYNDAPVSSGIVLQGLYDIGQIEVLRGPQGTLKGRASPSGSISITFRQPDLTEAGGYALGTVNNLNGFNINGAINVPIIEGKLGVRVAGLVLDDDGNRVRPVRGGVDAYNRSQAGRVSLRADPFDGILVVDASYSTMNRDSRQYDQVESVNLSGVDNPALGVNNPAGSAASPIAIRGKDRRAINSLPQDISQRIEDYNVSTRLSLLGQRLTYVGNWANADFGALEVGDDAGIFLNTTAPRTTSAGVPLSPQRTIPFAQPTASFSRGESHEMRLQNDDRVAGLFDYVVGYLYNRQNSDTNFEQIVTGFGNTTTGALTGIALQPLSRYSLTKENSIYGNVTAHLGDRAELSGGIRHIWFKSNSGVLACGLDFVGCSEQAALRRDLTDQATIFSLSAKYEVTDDLMAYVSYGTSWRPDAVFIGGPTVATPEQMPFLGTPPETSQNIEAGFKSSWFDNRLRVNISAFYQKFKNFPYRVPGLSGTGVFNVDRSRVPAGIVRGFNYLAAVPVTVKGVEGDFAFDITPRWNLQGTFAYSDGKIKNGVIPCNDLNGDGVPDALLSPPTVAQIDAAYGAAGLATCTVNMRANPAAPFSATLQSEYNHDLTDSLEGFLRGLYSFRGKSQGDPTNAWDQVSAFGLLNLYVGLRDADGSWEITAYGKNITDTFRVLTRSNTRNFTQTNGAPNFSTNYFGVTSTAPREFGLTARVAFGSR